MSSLLVLNPFLGGWGGQAEGRKGEKRTPVEPRGWELQLGSAFYPGGTWEGDPEAGPGVVLQMQTQLGNERACGLHQGNEVRWELSFPSHWLVRAWHST